MVKSQVGRPRGVLRGAPRGTLRHTQHAPSRDLAFWIEHYWIVEWNLTAPYIAETLPHPSVHLVLERGCSRITGVMLGRFSRTLDGLGGVFGIKFRPGAFRPILGRAVSTIANRLLDPHDLFGDIERKVLDAPDESSRIATAERVLRERLPGEDEKVEEVNRIMDFVLEDSAITRVDHLSARCGVSPRTLQRLFSEYVGVSPKWVINRYRLHEVLERVAKGDVVDWTTVALDLGYFDQAHFIRDFKKLVGRTPSEYATK